MFILEWGKEEGEKKWCISSCSKLKQKRKMTVKEFTTMIINIADWYSTYILNDVSIRESSVYYFRTSLVCFGGSTISTDFKGICFQSCLIFIFSLHRTVIFSWFYFFSKNFSSEQYYIWSGFCEFLYVCFDIWLGQGVSFCRLSGFWK